MYDEAGNKLSLSESTFSGKENWEMVFFWKG